MMKSVHLDHIEDPIQVDTRTRVLDVFLAAKANIMMACGGKGLCATCHCYVVEGGENLSPATAREKASLRMLNDVKPNSRLACQAKVLGEGVRVKLPKGTYIESTKDLESLIGRRAENPFLHPVDGRILIQEGKIITRSRIRELQEVDVDIAEMKARSLTVQ